jgi:vacuolar-type H+-ATPase subunit C/Vma6
MNAVASRAYGQARARARRAAILSEPVVIVMAGAPAVSRLPGWRDLGPADDGSAILALGYSRLVDDHVVMRRAYPEAREVLAALLQLHELENLKLLWRAAVRGTASTGWRGLWRPLGELQTIALESFAGGLTLPALTAALRPTPYAALAEAAIQAHGQDVAAAELAIDRFGTHRLASAHDRLPVSERSARTLLRAVIDRRDASMYQRARSTLGLTADAASVMITRAEHGGGRSVQSRLADQHPRITALTRRVLALEPFSLALPIALILLREDEVGRMITLSEVRARRLSPAEARRAMEAASLGQ